jgi:lycopene beta-cyclase
MIRGLDFYTYCFAELQKHASVTFLQAKVETVLDEEKPVVIVDGKRLTAGYVFNSIPLHKPLLKKKDIWLLQHFKGWMIETTEPAFDVTAATLMDFRIPQQKGTAFCYVLPHSPNKALVEYTLFTASLLQQEEYDAMLKEYISNFLGISSYRITETEFGVIPMTNYRFSRGGRNIINIGTAGGQTKGSSGYTFYFIQQHCRQMVQQLAANQHPQVNLTPKRFHFYDSVLLEVLDKNGMPGAQIFSTMFKKNKPQDVLAFLNNASTLDTEVKVISTLPTFPFLKAAIRQLI